MKILLQVLLILLFVMNGFSQFPIRQVTNDLNAESETAILVSPE